jgi:hypothetical protein
LHCIYPVFFNLVKQQMHSSAFLTPQTEIFVCESGRNDLMTYFYIVRNRNNNFSERKHRSSHLPVKNLVTRTHLSCTWIILADDSSGPTALWKRPLQLLERKPLVCAGSQWYLVRLLTKDWLLKIRAIISTKNDKEKKSADSRLVLRWMKYT